MRLRTWCILSIFAFLCFLVQGNSLFAQDFNEILQQHDPGSDAPIEQPKDALLLDATSPAPAAVKSSANSSSVVLAILSDLHVSSENLESCRKAVKAVNGLSKVGWIVLLGDLCEKIGTAKEFELATNLTSKFERPILAVPGNHDFLYADHFDKNGKKVRGTEAGKAAKLERFRKAFGQKSIRFSKKMGGHLLVFLPVDALKGKSITTLSETTLRFFKDVLEENSKLPTIVFSHAPLEGSFEGENSDLTPFQASTQPADRVKDILSDNPQVFLWVAGHRHTKPSSADFFSSGNRVGDVTVIHVPNIPESHAWIQQLELSPEAAVLRTYDVMAAKYLKKFDRRFPHKTASVTPPNGTPPADSSNETPEISKSQEKLFTALKQALKRLEAAVKKLLRLLG